MVRSDVLGQGRLRNGSASWVLVCSGKPVYGTVRIGAKGYGNVSCGLHW